MSKAKAVGNRWMRWPVAPLAVCVLLTAQWAAGEEPAPVTRIRLKTGAVLADETRPLDADLWRVGSLVGADEESLTIRLDGRRVSVRLARTDVSGLQVKRGHARGKGAITGAIVGLVAGFGLAAVENQRCESAGEWFCDLAWGLPLFTVPVGALIGLVLAPARWTEASPRTLQVGVTPVQGGVRVGARITF
jgi:hypothetical protein